MLGTKITDFSMTENETAKKRAIALAQLPYVTDIMMLPDMHIKDSMEAPSSMKTATAGCVAP